MDEMTCCVCQQPVGQDAPRLGKRIYCQEHYARVTHDRPSVMRSGALNILAVVLFAVIVALFANRVDLDLEGAALVLAGIVLAVVPAVLWLSFFYVQDRLEPEPKPYVLGVAVLAALLASAVGIPLVRNLFHVQTWLDKGLLINLLGAILIVGFIQEFLKYVAVRYSVYLLPEFDERMDGILYGTAAGLGYATMLNIYYVVESGGVDLGIGVVRIVVTALAHASFGGITGFFLARAKFEDEPVWWLPLGLTITAVLNGVFAVARGNVTRVGSVLTGSTTNPWFGLFLAMGVAVATLLALVFLMRWTNRVSLDSSQGA